MVRLVIILRNYHQYFITNILFIGLYLANNFIKIFISIIECPTKSINKKTLIFDSNIFL